LLEKLLELPFFCSYLLETMVWTAINTTGESPPVEFRIPSHAIAVPQKKRLYNFVTAFDLNDPPIRENTGQPSGLLSAISLYTLDLGKIPIPLLSLSFRVESSFFFILLFIT
jgi:hypothetical protein